MMSHSRSAVRATLGCTLIAPALLAFNQVLAAPLAPASPSVSSPSSAATLHIGVSAVGNTITFKPNAGIASVRVQVKGADGAPLYDSGWMMGFDAGLDAVTWQALDAKGAPLPAGVYFTQVDVRSVDGTTKTESGSLQLEAAPNTTTREVVPRDPITGSGTANRIVLWTSATTIGDSIITQTNSTTLSVAGTINAVAVNATNNNGNALVGNSKSGTALAGITQTGNGVLGTSTSANGMRGVTGTGIGVRGDSNNGTFGVQGNSNGASSNNSVPVGVDGNANGGASSIGVRGTSSTGTGISGSTGSTVAGEGGTSSVGAWGVIGTVTPTSPGGNSAGVRGVNNGTSTLGIGVYGSQAGSGFGVYGYAPSGYGIYGQTNSGYALYGSSSSGYGLYANSSSNYGVYGNSSTNDGVRGVSGNSYGVSGISTSNIGVYGLSNASQSAGVKGTGYLGVLGNTNGTVNSQAIRGENNGSTTGYAGVFTGKVQITGDLIVNGTLSKGGGSFRIDDPLDPANKYLSHSFVESPDMMNIYNGTIVLDKKGGATVTMPAYFQALNRDFRYQLTPIGAPGPNLYVARKINGNTWKIAGGKAGMEVSWQVTGVRRDPWANDHRIPTQELKTGAEHGRYLYPAGYHKPESLNMAHLVDVPRAPKPTIKTVAMKPGAKHSLTTPQPLKTSTVKQPSIKPVAASHSAKTPQRVAQAGG